MKRKNHTKDFTQTLEWTERVATFFAEQYGLPAITGRIMGWLLICDPAEQSPSEIADAIGASRASLTTNMRFLVTSGLVRRLTRPGSRTSYYRIDDDMWDAVIRRRISSMVSFDKVTVDGLNLIGPNSARAARLRAAHKFFALMAELLAKASSRRRTAD